MGMENRFEKFSLGTLLQIAMVPRDTFISWQRRYGFLARERGDRTHKLYSGAEICAARAMVAAINAGINAPAAAKMATKALEFFQPVWEQDSIRVFEDSYLVAADEGTDEGRRRFVAADQRVDDLTKGEDGLGECGVVMNLGLVVLHVMVAIQNLQGGAQYALEGGPAPKAHPKYRDADAAIAALTDLQRLTDEVIEKLGKSDKARK